jgi:hypothetical protein
MTEQDLNSSLWAAAELALAPVGFQRIERSEAPVREAPAHSHFLYRSSYAWVHLAWIGSSQIVAAADIGRTAVEDISTLLKDLSQADQRLDGYVILALPLAPKTEELRNFVRSFETERLVCRRHVIWPAESSESWAERLDRVTFAALPETSRLQGDSLVTARRGTGDTRPQPCRN